MHILNKSFLKLQILRSYRKFLILCAKQHGIGVHTDSKFNQTWSSDYFHYFVSSFAYGRLQYRKLSTEIQHYEQNKVIKLIDSKRFDFVNKNGINKLDTQAILNIICEKEEHLTEHEWETLKIKFMNVSNRFNNLAFGTLIMEELLLRNNYLLAVSFMDYLEAKTQPNISTLAAYLNLCGKNVDKCGENVILNTFNKLLKKVQIMDLNTLTNVVGGLCYTSHWIHAYKLLQNNQIKLKISTDHRTFIAVACAAFRSSNIEIALILIEQMRFSIDHRNIYENLYKEWINAAQMSMSKIEGKQLFEKLLSILSINDMIVSNNIAKMISQCFKSFGKEELTATFVSINENGICPNCKKHLESTKLDANEFEQLKTGVLHKLLKGSDVFLQTTPKELERFQKFLKERIPYDIVIDGLNVSYFKENHDIKNKFIPKINFTNQLLAILKYFKIKRKMKVLVLGRKHMMKWPKMDLVSRMCDAFYLDNLTKDDPFIIYAALVSGPQTLILTNDFLRGHKFLLLDSDLSKYFETWRNSHQIYIKTKQSPEKMIFQEPVFYRIAVQGSVDSGWHIPYTDITEPTTPESHVPDICKQWLCISKEHIK